MRELWQSPSRAAGGNAAAWSREPGSASSETPAPIPGRWMNREFIAWLQALDSHSDHGQ